MFIPGETVTHTFIIPYEKSAINTVIISYRQKDTIILEKFITSQGNMTETEDDQTMITAALTEQESLLFVDNCQYGIQINVLFEGGGRSTSQEEIIDWTGRQHIRQVGQEASEQAKTAMYIDSDGYLVYTRKASNPADFSIDSDGYLVLESEGT